MTGDTGVPMDEVLRIAQQLTEQRELVRSATRQCTGLATILRGYIQMFPDELAEFRELSEYDWDYPDPDSDQRIAKAAVAPKGAEAARLILQERPGIWFYVSELVAELRDRGWMPDSDNPANAVRAALERLRTTKDSDIYKGEVGGKVAYSFDPDRVQPYDPAEEPF